MLELGPEALAACLTAVGDHLAAAREQHAIVIVGGAALNLAGHLRRTTQDVDVYARAGAASSTTQFVSAQPLPESLARAVAKVARDFSLPDDWLNAVVSPSDLSDLPPRFTEELRWKNLGGLRVGVAGRTTLIALKLHAAVDRDKHSVHVQDLLALRPTDDELDLARAWVVRQDIGPGFAAMVDDAVAYLRERRRGRP